MECTFYFPLARYFVASTQMSRNLPLETACLCACVTCLQWFSNTIRHVSGSAVHGLDGTTVRLFRPSGPLGVIRLSQLILASLPNVEILEVELFQDRREDQRREGEERERERGGREKKRGEERERGEGREQVIQNSQRQSVYRCTGENGRCRHKKDGTLLVSSARVVR